jgi:hypothetical protein
MRQGIVELNGKKYLVVETARDEAKLSAGEQYRVYRVRKDGSQGAQMHGCRQVFFNAVFTFRHANHE